MKANNDANLSLVTMSIDYLKRKLSMCSTKEHFSDLDFIIVSTYRPLITLAGAKANEVKTWLNDCLYGHLSCDGEYLEMITFFNNTLVSNKDTGGKWR